MKKVMIFTDKLTKEQRRRCKRRGIWGEGKEIYNQLN